MSTTAQLNVALAGRYTIERQLGAGGMATVYLAHDVRHDRKVALKVLRPELSAILGAERFLAEIKTTANLQHPHILSLFDSGEADGTVFYVMPYVEGESLRDRLKREQQLPVEEAVRIAREVLDALEYAHQHGIVHRDIKPENILLHGGHAMVADFGIALAASKVDGGTRMTETGMSLGTPHYMSPEQAMGERVISGKADIYALGVVLYEMLTGEPPFTGQSAQAVFARVLTDEPRSLTLQRKTIPPHVESAVNMALEKLPADRFASARAFSDALAKADFAAPMTRQGTAAPATSVSIPRRFRDAAPWALLALVAAAAAVGWLRNAEPEVSRQRIALWDHSMPAGELSKRLDISPDGRSLVFVDSVNGTRQLWIKDRGELEPRPVTGTVGAMSPAFSADGEWIAFASDFKLKKVPRQGGSAVVIADSMNMDWPVVAWLDDSIAYNDLTYRLYLVSRDGGPSRMIARVDSLLRGFVSATPLPGARGLVVGTCTAACAEYELRALDLESGTLHLLLEDAAKGWYTSIGHVVFVRRDGGVFSAPFDVGKLAFASPPVPVFNGVRTAPGVDFVMSAGGSVIYAKGDPITVSLTSEVVWVSRDGKATPVDSSWTFRSGGVMAISPDGRRLAISITAGRLADIWIKQLDRGPVTRLTFAGVNDRPAWTADGRTVLYVSNQGGNEDIRARRADGTGAEQTLIDIDRSVVDIKPTPDSTRWIVRYAAPPSRDIFLWHSVSRTSTPLLADTKMSESQAALSPNGRWLAYVSNESGRPDVYVRPFPNVDGGKWQVSQGGGTEPLWSHSGRELFFRDERAQLISVPVRPGVSFETGGQRALFSTAGFDEDPTTHRRYDVSVDDRRFLFMRRAGGPAVVQAGIPNLVHIENWFAELRAAAGRR